MLTNELEKQREELPKLLSIVIAIFRLLAVSIRDTNLMLRTNRNSVMEIKLVSRNRLFGINK